MPTLLEQAALDAQAILEDSLSGFAQDITITDPAGTVRTVKGSAADIFTALDPETGQLVASRKVSAAVSIASLTAVGFGIPVAVAAKDSKPWLVTVTDALGASHTFKVAQVIPDRTLGVVALILQGWVVIPAP